MRVLTVRHKALKPAVQFLCYKSIRTFRQWLKRQSDMPYRADCLGMCTFHVSVPLIEVRYSDDAPSFHVPLLHEIVHAADFWLESRLPEVPGADDTDKMEFRAYAVQGLMTLAALWHEESCPPYPRFTAPRALEMIDMAVRSMK